ncbi:hypothetical protein [Pseudobacteroides cellulosolvens]|uniref:Uncharacterized protein n=1 Tax=Pseudobacteroides cellulosolvens ATCC 35603 = DSM 2933 TaxID=398512 RepID=A0A0L6JID7_9FIRM|nr:hypothetical protein [Pseudobacteroides cellulosolvens]KNY25490.1 hypothetical protein Bccel_0750 [Pseudobacteroides cellulosolvens ATCC 35603 = DSM 2933]
MERNINDYRLTKGISMAADCPQLFYEYRELEQNAGMIILKGCREHLKYFNNRRRLIQIFKYNFTHLYIHWEIFDLGGTYYICRTKWYFETDSEKFRNPVERLKYPKVIFPTITCKSSVLREEFINKSIEQIMKSPINPISFEKKQDFCNVRYEIIINDNTENKKHIFPDDGYKHGWDYLYGFVSDIEEITDNKFCWSQGAIIMASTGDLYGFILLF